MVHSAPLLDFYFPIVGRDFALLYVTAFCATHFLAFLFQQVPASPAETIEHARFIVSR
jgi:hypothetical protein